jgi:two-component system, chemotaxis family, CheB/CheR fusion protein
VLPPPDRNGAAGADDPGPAGRDPLDSVAVDRLVRLVRERTGFDLTGYRLDGLARRAVQRAVLAGEPDLSRYTARVAVDDAEVRELLDHLLVQVSGWFRDPHVWQVVRDAVLPGLAGRDGARPVRAWVAGCGEGQEVYSLAACLSEAVGQGHLASWSVLATDVDPHALRLLARAQYPRAGVPHVGRELLAPHLLVDGAGWRVAPSLTARVRAARHDVRDAPPDEARDPFDLVMCRNVLMYLDDVAQTRVLEGLVASLRPGGVLVLGKAELPITHRDALVPVDVASRVYRSIASPLRPPG